MIAVVTVLLIVIAKHTAPTFHPLTLNIHFTTFDKPVKYYITLNNVSFYI